MNGMSDLAASDYNARLTSVEVIGDYEVRVTFSDGVSRDVDLRRHFVNPSGILLGPPSEFACVRVRVESDTLCWDNDFHEHGELLYER